MTSTYKILGQNYVGLTQKVIPGHSAYYYGSGSTKHSTFFAELTTNGLVIQETTDGSAFNIVYTDSSLGDYHNGNTNRRPQTVVLNNSIFVYFQTGGNGNSYVYSSSDNGVTWTKTTIAPHIASVVNVNNTLYAVTFGYNYPGSRGYSTISKSTNGIDWQSWDNTISQSYLDNYDSPVFLDTDGKYLFLASTFGDSGPGRAKYVSVYNLQNPNGWTSHQIIGSNLYNGESLTGDYPTWAGYLADGKFYAAWQTSNNRTYWAYIDSATLNYSEYGGAYQVNVTSMVYNTSDHTYTWVNSVVGNSYIAYSTAQSGGGAGYVNYNTNIPTNLTFTSLFLTQNAYYVGGYDSVNAFTIKVPLSRDNWSYFSNTNGLYSARNLSYAIASIGGQGSSGSIVETLSPVTLYIVPANTQTVISSIFATNHDTTERTVDIAVVPAGQTLSTSHHIRWDYPVSAQSYELVTNKLTLQAGDSLVVLPSTASEIGFTAMGVELS